MQKKCNPGVGLRSTHFPYLEKNPKTHVKWFEAVSENYMDSYGRPRLFLKKMRENYPVALHGVSMNLLSPQGLNDEYLENLKNLIEEIDPFIVSDHLCWTGIKPSNIHDLLPFPYTKESLDTVCQNIDYAQNKLGRNLVIENVSTYMTFKQSEYTEWDFLTEVSKRTDSKLLLDINNIYVSSANHGFDPFEYIDKIPTNIVSQVHLAGYTDMGDFLFDTHSKPVYPEVWKLFKTFIKKAPNVPFMMEWDEDIPEFQIVEGEVLKAIDIWKEVHDEGEKSNVKK
ncbi:MAG: DUF692 domain-containing protein [Bdellovibrionales bacterium]|nr:DUF692 domain-containing protein [Bdellovibrionales bacterium]